MIYLLIPVAVWTLTAIFLRIGMKETGFDVFFRHFSLIGIEGILCYMMYKIFPIEGGWKVFLYFVGAHSALLFIWAMRVALQTLVRRKMSLGSR